MYTPIATYRLQFHAGFTFRQLQSILSYLKELGISTLYASPVFGSRPGSTHNYDVVNPHIIDPEIGSLEEFKAISEWLKEHDMGWLQDIVPNHMAFDRHNEWLMEVLQLGEFSDFGSFFDINWNSQHPDWKDKVMVPFLGVSLEKALENNELKIVLTEKGFFIAYYDNKFPLNHKVYEKILDNLSGKPWKAPEKGDRWNKAKAQLFERYQEDEWFKSSVDQILQEVNQDKETLRNLLKNQFFALEYWKASEQKINYRRFFTINDLICLSMERPGIFEEYHRLIGDLVKKGNFQGLRIDHIDGLFDPKGYLDQLREQYGEELYVLVEKILEWEEELPQDWAVEGTTGYEFLAQVSQLFTNPDNGQTFEKLYDEMADLEVSFEELVFRNKYFILTEKMGGELENLLHLAKQSDLVQIKESDWQEALAVFMAGFPVYRIYFDRLSMSEQEKEIIHKAYETALKYHPELKEPLEQIRQLFLSAEDTDVEKNTKRLYFLQRTQQFTGPLAAKGVEDTTFYQYNRLISHNEVGDTPGVFGLSIEGFHQKMKERFNKMPHALNTTATHDTKRGEDARIRINVLSEIPEKWAQKVREWRKINQPLKKIIKGQTCPDDNEEYFIYQMLMGVLPFDLSVDEELLDRIEAYLVKALREAKVNTDWSAPEVAYEEGVVEFVRKLLRSEQFLNSFKPLFDQVAHGGKCYSLGQTLIKMTAPGVPDVYQGCEYWDFSLVDPDNRRPVDYQLRQQNLEEIIQKKRDSVFLKHLLESSDSGQVKQYVLYHILKRISKYPEVFQEGDYVPLQVSEGFEHKLLAFARRKGKSWFITLVPLRVAEEIESGTWPLGDFWKNAFVPLPAEAPHQWTECLSGNKLNSNGKILLAEAFKDFPVALLKFKV